MDFLMKTLQKATVEEFKLANKHVTKETIETRVFEKISLLLGKTHDDSRLYIHPEVSAFLSRHVPPDHIDFDFHDRLLMSRIYSADYHDLSTLHEFCRVLDSKIAGPVERNRIYRAFAVDGFRGNFLLEYASNLQFPFSRFSNPEDARKKAVERHVSGVRLLYETFDTISVETIAIVIRNAMDYVESADPDLRRMTDVYLNHVLENFDDIKTFIDILKDSINEKVLIE